MRKLNLGAVILHGTGRNPYDLKDETPARIGDHRIKALKLFRQTGRLPLGVSAWNDRDRKPIDSPEEIDWSGFREEE